MNTARKYDSEIPVQDCSANTTQKAKGPGDAKPLGFCTRTLQFFKAVSLCTTLLDDLKGVMKLASEGGQFLHV